MGTAVASTPGGSTKNDMTMNNETGEVAETMEGNKLYQERARRAMPILVRQALAGETIYYQDLADELGMPNPRNLNFVLGSPNVRAA